MENYYSALYYVALFLFFLIIEIVLRRAPFKGISWQNHLIDGFVLFQSMVLIRPIIVLLTAQITVELIPEYKNILVDVPHWQQFLAFLFLEDMVQYWWHRSAHTFKFLWPLHRVHHAAPYMGIRVWLRNGFFYGLLMPNIWFSIVLVYLGFGEVYIGYSILKAVVTAAAHSELRWDSVFYRYRFLRPFAWLIEHTFSTPATHFAHHALNEGDGIGNLNGNFGNLLFVWDQLFGTALFSRQYPPAFGIQEDYELGDEKWYVHIFYPIFRTSRHKENRKSENEESALVLEKANS